MGGDQSSAHWREQVFEVVLRWTVRLGTGIAALVLVAALLRAPERGGSPAFWLMFIPYGALLVLWRSPRLPFRPRVITYLVVVVAEGAAGIYAGGAAPAPPLVLALAVVCAGLMLGRGAMWWTLLGSTAAHLAVGLIFHMGGPRAMEVMGTPSPGRWIAATIGYALATAMIAVLVQHVVERIEAALRAAASALRQRDHEVRRRSQTEAALDETEAALLRAQKLEAVGRLAAGVGHDFNNALQVVLSWTELLRSTTDRDTIDEGLSAIEQAGRRSSELTRRLLTFGRRDVRAPLPMSPSDALQDLSTTLRQLLPEDIHITTEIAETPTVLADATQLDQVLLNLGINARDAMPTGGLLRLGADTVDAREVPPPHDGDDASNARRWAHLWVRDDGVGMDAATLERIFDPFFTTKGERGSGLGLATAHAIIRQHGGVVTVDSHPGRGTCFHVYLPETEVVAEATQEARAEPGRNRRAVVMLAEDDEAVRVAIERALARAELTVLTAADADAAVDLLSRRGADIDVLCTDAIMPGGGTRELIDRYLKARPGGEVIICSGYVQEELLRRRIDAGTLAFLPKPFAPAELLKRIHTALQRQQR